MARNQPRRIKVGEWYFLSIVISVTLTIALLVVAAGLGWLRGDVLLDANGSPLIDPITKAPARDINPLASPGGMLCMLITGSALGPVVCLFVRLATVRKN